MAASNTIDLAGLQLRPGEGRRVEVSLADDLFEYGGQRYELVDREPALVEVSRMQHGFAFHMRFTGRLQGPCMRCLDPALIETEVEAREIDQPGGGEELESPYVEDENLRVAGWAHDALALALPEKLLCRADCAGLCPVCGESLNGADDGAHDHPREPDPRWDALRELKPE